MNIEDLTIGQARSVAKMFGQNQSANAEIDNGMIGKYVIVRCRDAGVHAGFLSDYAGRSCLLTQARRLWYFKPANNSAFLSGVAAEGLHPSSKVGVPITVHLTETCEIILCTETARKSIEGILSHEPE